jgi:hypothetical protein
MAVGSSAIAEPISGLAGIAALPFGADKAAKVVEGVQRDMTYQPRSGEGQRGMRVLADTMAPVGEFFDGVSQGGGDYVMDKTGSPLLASLAYAAPTVVPEIFGLKGAKVLGGKKYTMGDIGSQVTGAGRRELGSIPNITRKKQAALDELKRRGYDVDNIFYHGTDKEFKTFDKKKIGSTSDFGIRGKGFYFSPDKKTASGYGKNVKEVNLKYNNPIDLQSFNSAQEVADYLDMPVESIKFRVDELPSGNFKSVSVNNNNVGRFTTAIKDKGHDAIIHGKETIVFDESQIEPIN